MEAIPTHSHEEVCLLLLEQKISTMSKRRSETVLLCDGSSALQEYDHSGDRISRQIWKDLPPCVKEEWNTLARRSRRNGCELFVSTNAPRICHGQPVQLARSSRHHDWLAFSAAPGPDSGEIFVSFTTGRNARFLVCALRPAGLAHDEYPGFDFQVFSTDGQARHIIPNLHSGLDYEVHAFTTGDDPRHPGWCSESRLKIVRAS